MFFIDTFRVYITNLLGTDSKTLIDVDLKSSNNFINQVSLMPSSNKLVYTYQDGKITKIANADGSNKKVFKTFDKTQIFIS